MINEYDWFYVKKERNNDIRSTIHIQTKKITYKMNSPKKSKV